MTASTEHLAEVRRDFPVVRPFALSDNTISSASDSGRYRLRSIRGIERRSRVSSASISTGPISVITILEPWPLPDFRVPPGTSCFP